jgi:WXG100 family type VII secretion target
VAGGNRTWEGATVGNQLKTDLEVMGGVASKLANDFEQLQASITTLQGEAEAHSATWSGEAKNAWAVAMSDVNTAWAKLNGVLDEITSNINVSGGHYGDTDTTNASGYKGVPITEITSSLSR